MHGGMHAFIRRRNCPISKNKKHRVATLQLGVFLKNMAERVGFEPTVPG